jgi:hypothetical protein
MIQSCLKRGLHLVGSRTRNNLSSYVVQMFFKPLNFALVPALKRMRHDLSQVAISGHTRRPRLGFQFSCMLFRQVNRQVHRVLSSGYLGRHCTLRATFDKWRGASAARKSYTIGPSQCRTSSKNYHHQSPRTALCLPKAYATIDSLSDAFLHATQDERDNLTISTGPELTSLLGFAWHAAEEAVQTQSLNWVKKGLLAMAIEGGSVDLRDNIVRIAVLFNSARHLDPDPAILFREVAALARNPALRQAMTGFPHRPPETRDLKKAFMIHESGRGTNFSYKFRRANATSGFRRFWPFSRRFR